MCGFVTGVDPVSSSPDLRSQIDLLSHRGPDDQGLFSQDVGSVRVNLAHRRLSIIDLSMRGHQPMQVSVGGPTIVFNGEIYNFQELRGTLESRGHRFQSKTDTEVLLTAYLEWGESCLDHLAGMWAFVIWDPRKKILFGSRDRFGIKPLYYYQDHDRFLAASEIKALLAHPAVRTAPNEARVLDYFLFNLHDHTAETMFEKILQIPPAHAFRYDLAEKRLNVWPYWRMPPASAGNGADLAASAGKLREDLLRSVREHLVADVPVGFCLSGGIDSSSIVGLARALKRDIAPMVAFTSAYDNSPFDEREYVREVVEAKAIDWHVVIPSPEKMFEDLEKMIYFQDEPPVHSSVYAQWCVMRLAKENKVTVLLDGQGADELFAGYPAYRDVRAADLMMSGRWIEMLRVGSPLRAAYALSPAGLKAALFKARSPAWRALNAGRRAAVSSERLAGTFENFQYRDLSARLNKDTFELHLPKLLHYEDRNSMAFSIESRVPFLDHRVAVTARETPVEWKLSPSGSKWILREAMREFVPAKVLNRKDKIGFATPQTEWLKKLLAKHGELLTDGWAAQSLSHPDLLRRMIASGGENAYAAAWKIICLNQWHRVFFRRAPGDRLKP